jgi:hypothetical protein
MTAALTALTDLLARLGDELDFDVAHDVSGAHGCADVVWFDRSMPLAGVDPHSVDVRTAPVLPVVAFVARTAAMLDDDDVAQSLRRLEGIHAPLRVLIVARDGKPPALAPIVQSVEQMRRVEEDATLRTRIAESLPDDAREASRTIVMLQSECIDWARRLREARPRSYSAESMFNRTGRISD